MPRKNKGRIYWRNGRAWADFRDFVDVGGRQEALAPEGHTRAATDPDIASQILAKRLAELQMLRQLRQTTGLKRIATLAEFAEQHLRDKAGRGDVADDTIAADERHLQAAVDYLGNRPLTGIRPSDVKRWMKWLRTTRKARGGLAVSGGTVRHYINSLSNLYRAAQEEEVVSPGYNPVASLMTKPKGDAKEPTWFEVHDTALILEAARTYQPTRPELSYHYVYPLLATFLLTGGRRKEVLGLEVADVSFDRKTVTFRSNDWRRLKTQRSNRVIPLWPQLADILNEYLIIRPPSLLLFPAFVNGREQMVTELRKMFDAIMARIDWRGEPIRAQAFRNTYCAARLQTLDNGKPVSIYTVARELGHTSVRMVERVYAHLGEMRHRSEDVEYRVEDFEHVLGERLVVLRATAQPTRVMDEESQKREQRAAEIWDELESRYGPGCVWPFWELDDETIAILFEYTFRNTLPVSAELCSQSFGQPPWQLGRTEREFFLNVTLNPFGAFLGPMFMDKPLEREVYAFAWGESLGEQVSQVFEVGALDRLRELLAGPVSTQRWKAMGHSIREQIARFADQSDRSEKEIKDHLDRAALYEAICDLPKKAGDQHDEATIRRVLWAGRQREFTNDLLGKHWLKLEQETEFVEPQALDKHQDDDSGKHHKLRTAETEAIEHGRYLITTAREAEAITPRDAEILQRDLESEFETENEQQGDDGLAEAFGMRPVAFRVARSRARLRMRAWAKETDV